MIFFLRNTEVWNLLQSLYTAQSRKFDLLSLSSSIENGMRRCRDLRYVENICACDTSLNNKKVSSTYRLHNIGLNNSGQLSNHNFSLKHIKIFEKVGPNGRPVPNPSICRYSLLSKNSKETQQVRLKFEKVPYLHLIGCTASIHKERAQTNINSFPQLGEHL